MKVSELFEADTSKNDAAWNEAVEFLKNKEYRYRKATAKDYEKNGIKNGKWNSREVPNYPYVIANASLWHDERSMDGSHEKSELEHDLKDMGVPADFVGYMVFFGFPTTDVPPTKKTPAPKAAK